MSSSPLTRFVGYAMVAIGALITLLSGACTLFFLGAYLQPHGDFGMIWVPIVIGGPFIVIGLFLIAQGRSVARWREPPDVPPGGDQR